MNHTSIQENKMLAKKIVSYLYSFLVMTIGFFAGWTFFSVLKITVGLNTEVYWLSKALIQQVSFIIMMMVICAIIIFSQHVFEKAMINKGTWLPKSLIIISLILGVFYGICKIIVLTY